ncbi:hemerythrin domain-containing protein [Yinghuangia seranimata]|uniref:hemerythrin domain-containing protein n=1 Tax=Yinghuangia seranimata TaxID=408067 RepID=UPI00248C7892|nr:hemerythrin domain-containing protein [Yinghuangia seranimata]MDI2129864.1 hemerythrin domain-containing protein [Yinghuangia seranimata]
MATTKTPAPRTAAEATPPNLSSFTVVHRSLRDHAERLTALLAELGPSLDPIPAPQAEAIAEHVEGFLAALSEHHHNEDEILWPVVAEHVGDAADLAALVAEHRELDGAQERAGAIAARFGSAPRAYAMQLATDLAELRDLLAAHLDREEAELFPLITAHMPGEVYAAAESRIMRAGALELVPWFVSSLTDEERASRPAPPPEVAAELAPHLKAFAERERAVYGH